jgi:hypothetical protein
MIILNSLALALMTFSLFAQDIQIPAKPIDIDVDFQASYFETKPWVKDFRYVIVINKAKQGLDSQTIKVYEDGNLIIKDRVSTGRDDYETIGQHYSKKNIWAVTPTGYYTPLFLDKNHKSDSFGSKWSWLHGGVKMPYAIFFNEGIALHQAPKGTEGNLGTNASGGCVRISKNIASDIFSRIEETQGAKIPKFNIDGSVVTDASGKYIYSHSGFSALIIVKDKLVKQCTEDLLECIN